MNSLGHIASGVEGRWTQGKIKSAWMTGRCNGGVWGLILRSWLAGSLECKLLDIRCLLYSGRISSFGAKGVPQSRVWSMDAERGMELSISQIVTEMDDFSYQEERCSGRNSGNVSGKLISLLCFNDVAIRQSRQTQN
jgi:hypothetical protein